MTGAAFVAHSLAVNSGWNLDNPATQWVPDLTGSRSQLHFGRSDNSCPPLKTSRSAVIATLPWWGSASERTDGAYPTLADYASSLAGLVNQPNPAVNP